MADFQEALLSRSMQWESLVLLVALEIGVQTVHWKRWAEVSETEQAGEWDMVGATFEPQGGRADKPNQFTAFYC